MKIFDKNACQLGEGPLWHPKRKTLFWFDIIEKKLFERSLEPNAKTVVRNFDVHVSAAGWINEKTLLIASEQELFKLDLDTNSQEHIVSLEANNPITRSNDGRADPWGGFWIGTMGKNLEPEAGAIYRYYKGELRKLFNKITISNAICFAPNKPIAYFCDTPERVIKQQKLDPSTGWPVDDPSIAINLSDTDLNPDGAVVDSEGCVWNAQYGAGRLARYTPNGMEEQVVLFHASQATCPAFGGPDLNILFATSAADGLDLSTNENESAGQTFFKQMKLIGQAEHQVILA
ncbi:MAG: SMP-30/gluconolactonase/LRE family protein [Alphaproteobacteria bacterium]